MRPRKYRKDKTPTFITKLYRILSDPTNAHTITWTKDNTGFIILNLNNFTKEILPRYFKHANYNSFVRQLNMYNFSKIRYFVEEDQGGRQGEGEGEGQGQGHGQGNRDGGLCDHVYQHVLFVKGEVEGFRNIRRKEAVRCDTLMQYGKYDEGDGDQQIAQPKQLSVIEKLKDVKQKQQKLQQFCFQLISQNQILLTQNQELAHKVKKQSKKKQKILQQVFRIVGASIAEFWQQFCQDTETIEEKTNNFKQIYQILMSFIDNNDLNQILKTLDFFIAPKSKAKIFKVINSNQSANFLSNYSEEEVEEFISETNLILQAENNRKCSS